MNIINIKSAYLNLKDSLVNINSKIIIFFIDLLFLPPLVFYIIFPDILKKDLFSILFFIKNWGFVKKIFYKKIFFLKSSLRKIKTILDDNNQVTILLKYEKLFSTLYLILFFNNNNIYIYENFELLSFIDVFSVNKNFEQNNSQKVSITIKIKFIFMKFLFEKLAFIFKESKIIKKKDINKRLNIVLYNSEEDLDVYNNSDFNNLFIIKKKIIDNTIYYGIIPYENESN